MTDMSIIEAAAALGVTENAVRKRIRRGSIAARKEGERWIVSVDEEPSDAAGTGPGHGGSEASQSQLVEVLERENEFLRGQIDAKDLVIDLLLGRTGTATSELSGHLRHAIDGLIGKRGGAEGEL